VWGAEAAFAGSGFHHSRIPKAIFNWIFPKDNPLKFALYALVSMFASANALVAETAQKWTWIHTKSSGDFLQFERRNLPGGWEPVIDSVKVVGYQLSSGFGGGSVVKLDVRAWCRSVSIPETEGAKVRVGQVLKKIGLDPMIDPPLPGGYSVAFDSIDVCLDAGCGKVPVAKVANVPSAQLICIAMVCLTEADPEVARKQLVQAITSAKWAAVLDASIVNTLVAPNWWQKTTGAESYTEVVVPMVSNADNWLAIDKVMLGVSSVIKVGPKDPTIYEVPTGKIDYVYNRSANPVSKIAVQPWARIFQDSLRKTGPELWLTGSAQRNCMRLAYDSLLGRNAWLVLADSAGGVPNSLQFDALCGRRNRAWKVVGDSLWVTSTDKVSLSELLRTVGVDRRSARVASARIGHGASGIVLDLSEPSLVQVVSSSGQFLSSARMSAGRHELSVPGTGGVRFARVRSLASGATTILPLAR
jgi:hypothetical protein